MTDIGRAGMVMKGDYNSASTYETLDAVSYANGLYVAKQNVPAGTVPTNTTYWQSAIDTSGLLPKISIVTIECNDTGYIYGAYPTGFTKDNCVISGAMYYNPGNGFWYIEMHNDFTAVLTTEGVGIYVDSESAYTYNKTFKIILVKT